MNNTNSKDLFNEIQIPAFETGTDVLPPVPEFQSDKTSSSFPVGIIITFLIIIIVLVAYIIRKFFFNSVNINNQPLEEIQQEKEPEPIPKPHAVEIKAKRESKSFATPSNIQKCIRLFLENTRSK